MKARNRLEALVRDIRQDLDNCRQLEVQLAEQQRLLARQESDALSDIGQHILAYIDKLQVRAEQRSLHLQALGLPGGAAGITALAGKLPHTFGQRLKKDWEQLEQALARCKILNERNGELLASHRHALATLTGQSLTSYAPGHD